MTRQDIFFFLSFSRQDIFYFFHIFQDKSIINLLFNWHNTLHDIFSAKISVIWSFVDDNELHERIQKLFRQRPFAIETSKFFCIFEAVVSPSNITVCYLRFTSLANTVCDLNYFSLNTVRDIFLQFHVFIAI
jgi:hypothetical protein